MRNLKELKDIVKKLEVVEQIKEPLQKLLEDINTLLQQGHSWIDSKVNKTYQEMKELLDSEVAKFLRQCFCIANNGHEKFSETALTVEQLNQASNFVSVDVASTKGTDGNDNEHILGQIEKINANITSHTYMLQTLQHKIKKQKKSFKSVSQLKQETEAKFEEIMKELQEASNFMSTLSEELNETKDQIQDKKIQEIYQNVVNCIEQRDSIAKETVELLNKEVKRLTDELAQAVKSLETKEAEIVKLKDEIVAANDALKKKDMEIVRVIKVEDLKRCIEITLKKSNLNDEEIMAFWLEKIRQYCGRPRWLSRKDYISSRFDYCKTLVGVGLISEITSILNTFDLTTLECVYFWDEYKKCLNIISDTK